jgi:hypothetical protein
VILDSGLFGFFSGNWAIWWLWCEVANICGFGVPTTYFVIFEVGQVWVNAFVVTIYVLQLDVAPCECEFSDVQTFSSLRGVFLCNQIVQSKLQYTAMLVRRRCSNWSGSIVQRISTHKCNQGITNLWRQHLKWEEWARRSAGDQEFLEFKMQPATKPWMRFHGISIHRLFGFTKSPYIRPMSYNSV